MADALNTQLEIFAHRTSESDATLTICNCSQRAITGITGCIQGPHCMRAKTLSATFAVGSHKCESGSVSTLITEPCYWSPSLPFLYKIDLQVEWDNGTTTNWQQSIGLRRWEILGRSLFQERRRVVLRGAAIDSPMHQQLGAAAEAEIALVTHNLPDELLAAASELGVPLLIDLRDAENIARTVLARLSWYPSVAGVLLASKPSGELRLPNGAKLGALVSSETCAEEFAWADVLVAELPPTQAPAAWLSNCEKPVVGIRRDASPVDIAQVRSRCDLLQSDLAPEFDLAGYFV